jgi:exopolysaccharide production protein ExoZ
MIYSLQILRFLAALFVVLTHSMGELGVSGRIGAFGVDLFFVISGFIIAHVTEGDQSHFAAKRIIRIVPLYWLFTLFLAAVALVAPSLLNSAEFDVVHILSSLLFYPLWTEQTEFKPLLKLGWTLNYEVFFYVLFFVAMKISHRHREVLAGLLIAAAVTGVALVRPEDTNPLTFYGRNIMFEFVFGMALAKLYRSDLSWRIAPLPASALVVLGFVCMVLLTYQNGSFDRVVYYGLPSAAVLYAALCAEPWLVRLPARFRTVMVRAGDLSYPMYLIHIYVIAVIARLLDMDLSLGVLFAVALGGTILASWVVDVFYDGPLRRALRLWLIDRGVRKVSTVSN